LNLAVGVDSAEFLWPVLVHCALKLAFSSVHGTLFVEEVARVSGGVLTQYCLGFILVVF
jgi:hypothetical protein